jgi:hypothetical protein
VLDDTGPETFRRIAAISDAVKKLRTSGGRRTEIGSWDKDVDTGVLQVHLPGGNENTVISEE